MGSGKSRRSKHEEDGMDQKEEKEYEMAKEGV